MQLIHTFFGGEINLGDDNFVRIHRATKHNIKLNNSIKEVNSYHNNFLVKETLPNQFKVWATGLVDDSIEGKSVADMTRAKQIKSLFRMITPHLTIKDIPESQHQKMIADVQWLYNDQTFNNGLRLAMMNDGGLAGVHKNMVENIDNLLQLIDEEINK